ncbi:MAG TPA: hypothetical protein VJO34_03685 [Methylomirabilota bacterium]|nr:hypothetical protein [Methylomirabilota bacterium]
MPHTEAIDQHLKQMVQALHAAINRAMPHVNDDPKLVDQAIRDSKEILDVILEGNVSEWLGEPTEAR